MRTEPGRAALRTPEQESTDPLIGEQLGPYRIERLLGAGGMGVVYMAVDVALQRRVAVKVVSPLADSGVRRFIDEARRQARLDHANIVSVYGAGSELIGGQSTHWLAMQYVEGPTLAELVRGHGPLDPIDATSFVLDAARGLYFVHAEGFIHRDVKPANVLIDAADRALVADFGVAGDAAAPGDPPTGGFFLGTRAYASPEQLAGGRVDARSDVFSLGATWLFALTAHEPTVSGPGGRLPIDPALPPLLRETLGRMVENDVEARFPSMLDCIEAIERTLATLERGSRPPLAEPPTERRRRGPLRGIVVAAVALGGLLAGFAWVGPPAPSSITEGRRAASTRVAAAKVEPAPDRSADPPSTPTEAAGTSAAPPIETAAPADDVVEAPPAAASTDVVDARAEEAEAWASLALVVPGRMPQRLVRLEEEALAVRKEDRDAGTVALLRTCDRIAVELAAAWSPAFDAATHDVDGLIVDRYPLTHAQYFEFLRSALAADPSLFLAPLRPLDGGWVEFVDERPIRRPRLSALARPVVGLRTRAAELVAAARGQRIPDHAEWSSAIAPLHAATAPPRESPHDALHERVIWGDAQHFAAVVDGEVLVRDGGLERARQVLRLVGE